jgi:hypothetical protein
MMTAPNSDAAAPDAIQAHVAIDERIPPMWRVRSSIGYW